MENSDDKKFYINYSDIRDELKELRKDHDLLIEVRKDIQNMQNEVRHYMTTKADDKSLTLLKEGMIEWKKDLQDFSTSQYRSTQDEVKGNTIRISSAEKNIEELILTRAKQAGIYFGVSLAGGAMATIIPLLARFIKI